MKRTLCDKVKMSGDIPSPRFGHSFTMVSKTKAVLFGGAVSVSGINYTIQESLLSPMKHFFTIFWLLHGKRLISTII